MDDSTRLPYRTRTWWRKRLPWFLINLGVARKGEDCESAGGAHEWYNVDDQTSGCYHCKVTRHGQLWKDSQNKVKQGIGEELAEP